MPFVQDSDGNTQYIPGVYQTTRVSRSGPGPLPDFLIPIELAGAEQGTPYNVDTLLEANESAIGPFVFRGTPSAAADRYGADSDMAISLEEGFKHNLPHAYCVSMSALTRASIIVTSAATTVNEYKLYPKLFGSPGNFIKVKLVSGTDIEVTPLKQFSRLTANAGATDKRVYVRDASWVRDGMTISFGSDSVAVFTKIVGAHGTDLDANGQTRHWIDVTVAMTAITIADFATALEYDDARKEVSGTLADGQAQIDWFNDTSKILGATAESTFTNPAAVDALAAETVLREIAVWGTIVAGTSPAPTGADYTALITLLDASAYDQFGLTFQVLPYIWHSTDSASAVHATLRNWAIVKRGLGEAVVFVVGAGWGDVVVGAGDDTAPEKRASDLNSQDVVLCAGGYDLLGANLSLSAAVFGLLVGGGVGHNLTNDGFLYTSLEKIWDERNSGDLTTLHKGGVCTYRLSKSADGIRYKISQGLNTLQNNSVAWNTVTRDTPFVMQRILDDFVQRTFQNDLDALQVGADHVTPTTVAATLRARVKASLEPRGYIVIDSWQIDSIVLNAGATGFDVKQRYRYPTTADYITIENTILA